MDVEETMRRVTEADKIVEQLQNTDSMCQVAEIINHLDIDTMKWVLKKFVYMKG